MTTHCQHPTRQSIPHQCGMAVWHLTLSLSFGRFSYLFHRASRVTRGGYAVAWTRWLGLLMSAVHSFLCQMSVAIADRHRGDQ